MGDGKFSWGCVEWEGARDSSRNAKKEVRWKDLELRRVIQSISIDLVY